VWCKSHPNNENQVVTAYTTICPSPTTIVQNNVTYTVSSSTTLTITNCPCTITRSTQLPTSIAISVTPVGPTTTTSLTNPSLTTSSSITRATGAAATAGIAGTFGALIMGGLAAALL